MGRIRLLDDALVDQIAAGEVVERPSSVVKELLENALDADAQTVTVELVEGGRERIRILDDGVGMDAEDAALAVRRHATSKLRAFDDFRRLRTMGFRGEALASIASVSRFRLTTRARDAVVGTEVVVEGGEPEIRPVGCPPGTTIDVRELFFNVPARKKFLRARHTEASHVADVCLNVALARPYLRLTLVSNGRRVREYLPTLGRLPRAQAVFSDQRLTTLEGTDQGISIEAALGEPARATSGLRQLHFFVNGRPIVDRGLAHAVAFAFGDRLEKGKYPSGVLHLELDPSEVDVNAHPQKTEVRFADPHRIKDVVTRVLTSALGTAQWRGGIAGTPALAEVPPSEQAPGGQPSGQGGGAHGGVARDASYWKERLGLGPSAEPKADRWGITTALRDGELFGRASPSPASPLPSQSPSQPPSSASPSSASPSSASPSSASPSSASPSSASPSSASPSSASPSSASPSSASPSSASPSSASPSQSHPSASPSSTSPSSTSPSSTSPSSTSPSSTSSPSTSPADLVPRVLHALPGYWLVDADDGPRAVDRARLTACIFDALALPLPSRRLVFPVRVALDPKRASLVETHRDLLGSLGLDASWVGERDLALHTLPRLPDGLVSDADPSEILHALLDALADRRDPRAALRLGLALRAEAPALAALALHPSASVPLDAAAFARLFADPAR